MDKVLAFSSFARIIYSGWASNSLNFKEFNQLSWQHRLRAVCPAHFIIMEKYSKQDQKLLATWAADCAERALPFFEKAYPKDSRPSKAIEACRAWVRTGVFKMADIRKASLAAHAAAREADEGSAARFAARAAGQAVAAAHVPQHAFGAAYYALKAFAAANPVNSEAKIAKELNWQSQHLPKKLRQGWQGWQSRRLQKNLRPRCKPADLHATLD